MAEDYGMQSSNLSLDDIFAGDFPVVSESITILQGSGVLARGTVLGKITASGKYVPYDDAGSDGREVAVRILAHDIAVAAGEDAAAVAYRTGMFRQAALTGIDAAGIADLDALNLFVRS